MDFVHDTLADGRPFRILTVVDNWSRQSPVLEAGFRMSGETVGQVLDRVLRRRAGPRSITVDHGTEFQSRALGGLGLSATACSSISFNRANQWKMPSLNRLTGDCETSV